MTPAPRRVAVWDPLVRIGHWSLLACITLAWVTRSGGHEWHERFGYAALAIVLVRVIWGYIGPEHARFSSFVRSPKSTLRYARLVLKGREPRFIGHNPLGGWMIVFLLCSVLSIVASGWLYTTDRYWGVQWVEELHDALTSLLFGLVGLHVAGVALASYRHRENLVAAMLHGRKRAD